MFPFFTNFEEIFSSQGEMSSLARSALTEQEFIFKNNLFLNIIELD
jgi:hypothetical protein